ncbi:hypothetical protein [Pseudomonas serbica]|uniref:hypothetical protein n=1 Tax=Pseudomonas serbica TaxID=2965074 RepID=UPI00237B86C7|nr:hypothetical protein [Pseudomonas serbica]
MHLYTIHDISTNRTKLVGEREFVEFLIERGNEFQSAHALQFAIQNHGPRMVNGQFMITMHDTVKLGLS